MTALSSSGSPTSRSSAPYCTYVTMPSLTLALSDDRWSQFALGWTHHGTGGGDDHHFGGPAGFNPRRAEGARRLPPLTHGARRDSFAGTSDRRHAPKPERPSAWTVEGPTQTGGRGHG